MISNVRNSIVRLLVSCSKHCSDFIEDDDDSKQHDELLAIVEVAEVPIEPILDSSCVLSES